MPFLLQYENVAWYDNGKVRILDRRVYPTEVRFVDCFTYQEVVKAIADMVTQSAGPYTAAAMGMALAAYECRNQTAEAQVKYLEQASYTISHARPTTVARMQIITEGCLAAAIYCRPRRSHLHLVHGILQQQGHAVLHAREHQFHRTRAAGHRAFEHEIAIADRRFRQRVRLAEIRRHQINLAGRNAVQPSGDGVPVLRRANPATRH